jgi:predicted MFS family arabinose efflux permease
LVDASGNSGKAVGSRGPRVVVAAIAITIVSQFFRASTSTLGPELIEDLSLSPEGLGLANAAFFIALLASQIPIGMLFDRLGPRRVVTALSVLTVLGALLHAVATSEHVFVLARLLVGLGCAGSFMASVVLCVRWYPGKSFATMLSRVFALSNIGYLLAGTPWAVLAHWLGWRGAFAVSSVIAAATTYLFHILVRDGPGVTGAPRPERVRDIVRGLADIARVPGLLPILAMHFIAYASMITVFGVWAGPYLNDVHGFDSVARGNVLLAMGLAQMAGNFCYGPLDRRLGARKLIVCTGAALSILVLAALAVIPHPSATLAVAALVLFCLVDAYSVVNVADANSRFPPHLAGRGATTVNLSQVIGSAILPIVTGAVIGVFPASDGDRPAIAYRAAFAVIALCMAAGLALYSRAKPQPVS